MSQITINNHEINVVEYKGQRVITFKMMDELHGRAKGTARKRFNDNKDRLIEGEDYWKVCASEIRTHKIVEISAKSHEDVTLLTEAGYSMLVKSFTDDLAWQVQKALVRSYFRPTVAIAAPEETPEQLALRAMQVLQDTVARQKAELDEAAPQIDAYKKLASLDGVHNLRSAAQQCGWPERKFIQQLCQMRWIYTHNVTGRKCAYADKVKAGLMEAKNVEVKRTGYVEGVGQPMITQAGLAELRSILGPYEAHTRAEAMKTEIAKRSKSRKVARKPFTKTPA